MGIARTGGCTSGGRGWRGVGSALPPPRPGQAGDFGGLGEGGRLETLGGWGRGAELSPSALPPRLSAPSSAGWQLSLGSWRKTKHPHPPPPQKKTNPNPTNTHTPPKPPKTHRGVRRDAAEPPPGAPPLRAGSPGRTRQTPAARTYPRRIPPTLSPVSHPPGLDRDPLVCPPLPPRPPP